MCVFKENDSSVKDKSTRGQLRTALYNAHRDHEKVRKSYEYYHNSQLHTSWKLQTEHIGSRSMQHSNVYS
jgi:uncharacterized membrane protein YgaE (UPF0421/DUF939 family)